MNIARLLHLVDVAIKNEPPRGIKEYCGEWYSPYYHLMYLCAGDNDGWCVELGVEGGRGSNAMLIGQYHAGGHHDSGVIGIDNNRKPEVDRIISRIGFEFILGSSLPPPPRFEHLKKSIGVLHIDTEHTFAQAREEFTAYKPFLAEGAVVLFDDTNACEGEVLKYLMSLPYDKFVDDRLHPSCGYGGLVYEAKHDV